jgi:3-hydroxyacyl-[acyl-carrier-protein] dehydratase
MLIKDFYEITEFRFTENQVLAKISLNPDHEVYEGHFPEQPVVPGVIQLQIVKELLEKAVDQKLTLNEMAFSKFLNMIVPQNSSTLAVLIEFNLKENYYSFSAVIKNEEIIFTKGKGKFSVTLI